jgi:UDP-glucuronate 4-epimerase
MAHRVVTGGVGFIGFHLTRALLRRGDSVVVVDDFSDAPYPRSLKIQNASELSAEFKTVRIVEGCVTDRAAMDAILRGSDSVIHLAGLAGVRPSFSDPARYARVNVEGTVVVQQAARQAGVTRFLFASSSSIYGNATPLPASEDAAATVPESPYAATKRAAELVVGVIARKDPSMACTALRLFTVYGPRQRPEMAIATFARDLCAGRPLTLFGDGSMQRDFTHVDDVVTGALAALDRAPPGFRAYNLGSGAPIRLDALVQAMGQAAGVQPRIEHAPMPLGDVEATYADLTRARNELAYEPKVTLEEGLRTVLAWVRQG